MRKEEPKLVLLTYHRILPDEWRGSFYDVPQTIFREHLQILRERALRADDGLIDLATGGVATLCFDDGTEDHQRVSELLAERGLKGVFFIASGRLGHPGSLTEAQVSRMALLGHRIGSHSVTHRALTEMPDGELSEELCGSRRRLEDLTGQSVTWLAPPFGCITPRVAEAAGRAGYTVIRTMKWGYASLPPRGEVPCYPIYGQFSRKRFERILDGRASIWPYRLKSGLKRLIGLRAYLWMRQRSQDL